MRSGVRRGFTLLEMMIVVAIIAIGAGIAVFSIQSSRESISLERATAQVRAAIEQSRSLAALAGARTGTPRLMVAAPCTTTLGGNEVEVTINPGAGTVTYPSTIQNVAADGTMTLGCDVWTLSQHLQPGSTATFQSPAAATSFAFSSTGRLIGPSLLVRITSVDQPTINGFRVLPSGVLCQSSDPAPPPGGACDESPNW